MNTTEQPGPMFQDLEDATNHVREWLRDNQPGVPRYEAANDYLAMAAWTKEAAKRVYAPAWSDTVEDWTRFSRFLASFARLAEAGTWVPDWKTPKAKPETATRQYEQNDRQRLPITTATVTRYLVSRHDCLNCRGQFANSLTIEEAAAFLLRYKAANIDLVITPEWLAAQVEAGAGACAVRLSAQSFGLVTAHQHKL